jgi:hypothetical protein
MLSVWKYHLDMVVEQVVEMPCFADLLDVQEQDGRLVMWAIVSTDMTAYARVRVHLIGTGHPMPESLEKHARARYLGTAQHTATGLVLHCFYEVLPP